MFKFDQKSLALNISAACVLAAIFLEIISVFPFSKGLQNPRDVAASLMGTGLSLGFGVSVMGKGNNDGQK